jgi:hypothetical protein
MKCLGGLLLFYFIDLLSLNYTSLINRNWPITPVSLGFWGFGTSEGIRRDYTKQQT